MLPRFFSKDREKRKRFAHIGAAIVILIHAYEKYETGHGSPTLFAIAGIVFMLVAILHPQLEKKAPWIDGVFFVIEGILSLAVAYDGFHLGKKALPFTYLLLAVFQFVMAFKKGKKGVEHHRSSGTVPE